MAECSPFPAATGPAAGAPSHAAFLPARAGTAHDPFRARLDAGTGWRVAAEGGVVLGAQGIEPSPVDGSLTLVPQHDFPTDPWGAFGGLTLPANLALMLSCDLLRLDLETGALALLDPCACAFVAIPGLRRFAGATALAGRGRDLLIADPDAGVVHVLAFPDFARRRPLRPPGGELPMPWQPVAVAGTAGGRTYVGDPANGAIHSFTPSGTWIAMHPGFGAITDLALDRLGRLWIARGGETSALVVDPRDWTATTVTRASAAGGAFCTLPVQLRSDGVIDAGTLCEGGQGLFLADGSRAPESAPPAALLATEGRLHAGPIDSAIARCQWDRLELDVTVPEHCRVLIETLTTNADRPFDVIANGSESEWTPCLVLAAGHQGPVSAPVRSDRGRWLHLRIRFTGPGDLTPGITRIDAVYPRLGLAPYLPAVARATPAAADFTERFLGLFELTQLGIERQLDQGARLYDADTAPASRIPSRDVLGWLGGWIGLSIDRALPEALRRRILKAAPRELGRIGTPRALANQLLVLLGVDPSTPLPLGRGDCVPCKTPPSGTWCPPHLILEHFRVRRWLIEGLGRLGADSVLWGDGVLNHAQLDEGARVGVSQLVESLDPYRGPFHSHAHRFTVFIPDWVRCHPAIARAVSRTVEVNRPAHTQYTIRYVKPAMRIGQQAMLGFDSVIGRREGTPIALDTSELGKAGVLAGADPGEFPERLGQRSRLG